MPQGHQTIMKGPKEKLWNQDEKNDLNCSAISWLGVVPKASFSSVRGSLVGLLNASWMKFEIRLKGRYETLDVELWLFQNLEPTPEVKVS